MANVPAAANTRSTITPVVEVLSSTLPLLYRGFTSGVVRFMDLASLRLLSFFAVVSLLAPGQTSAPTSSAQLSPQAAYQDAMHPLQTTRNNIANWSDTELAAMTVTIGRARDACLARTPDIYNGADLVELSRLCALGQQWPAVVTAASRYFDADPAQPKPLLAEAFIAKAEALLRLKQEPAALASAQAMLMAVPYSPEVGDCIDEVLAYMRFVHTTDALTLAEARQPLLLTALRGTGAPAIRTQDTPTQPPSESAFSAAALYTQGLLLPALQQLAAKPTQARSTAAALDAALPKTLPADDLLRIAQARHRYALLGQPVPAIHPGTSLSMPYDRPPALPVRGAITAMLLFPDWCAQCVRMGARIPSTVFTVEGHSAYVYGLLAQTTPARRLDPKLTNVAYNPAFAADLMAETATVTVPANMLNTFEATDFPLLILADTAGILRVLEPVGPQDLQEGGEIDSAIALIGRNFNLPTPAAVKVAAPAH